MCQLFVYLVSFGSCFSFYMIAFIAYQRYEAVCKIFTRQSNITWKLAAYGIIHVVFVSLLINAPAYFTGGSSTKTVCSSYHSYSSIGVIWFVMIIIVFWVFPIILICLWNIEIVKELRRHALELVCTNSQSGMEMSRINSANTAHEEEPVRRYRDTDRRFTRMLILISMDYIFLLLPLLLRTVYFFYLKPTHYSQEATRFLVYHITNKLFMCNHAINFYLYCLSGARFRNDFIKLIKLPYRMLTE